MNEETVGTGSSPVEVDPFEGNSYTAAEFERFRRSNELPERFKPAEPAATAPADQPEETASEGDKPESAGDPEAPKDSQEKAQPKKLDRQGRAAQLDRMMEAELDKDEPDFDKIASWEKTRDRVLGVAEVKRKTDTAPATPPQAHQQQAQQAQPQTYKEWFASFDAEKWERDFIEANPTIPYARVTAAMADYVGDAREQFKAYEQAQQEQQREMNARVEQGKAQHGEEFLSIAKEAATAIGSDSGIHPEIKKRLALSGDLFVHVNHAINSEPGGLDRFIRMAKSDPWGAIDFVVLTQDRIRQEVASAASGKATPARDQTGKFVSEEPPAPKKTSAPKPPSPVGGGSSRTFDVNDESLSPDEWMRKRNTQKRS